MGFPVSRGIRHQPDKTAKVDRLCCQTLPGSCVLMTIVGPPGQSTGMLMLGLTAVALVQASDKSANGGEQLLAQAVQACRPAGWTGLGTWGAEWAL